MDAVYLRPRTEPSARCSVVWATMTDPANGISENFFEKGHDGERYLALTIGKARHSAGAPPTMPHKRASRSKARRIYKGAAHA